MDNRNNNTEKRDGLIGYVGISGSALGSMLIFPNAKPCPTKDHSAEPERKYTYKDFEPNESDPADYYGY